METNAVIAVIRQALDEHCPGTYKNGFRMAEFLRKMADEIEEEIGDSMSMPE